MPIRTFIVDDEPLARSKLRTWLAREPDVEIVGEAGDGASAIQGIQAQRPDLVFLDVQMPELDGFAVLKKLNAEVVPAVIFVTAHDQFALKAFEVHAADYLLKPFDHERFSQALQHARQVIQQRRSGHSDEKLASLLADLSRQQSTPDRLAIKTEGRILLLKPDDIDWVEASDNYVRLHVGKSSHLHRETLTSIEGQLPANRFIRINRSTIVNIDRIQELQPLFHGDYSVLLRDGTRLTLSRSHRSKLSLLTEK